MRTKKSVTFLTALILLTNLFCSNTEHDHAKPESVRGAHHQTSAQQISLPSPYLDLLRKEMQQIESGMQLLLDYLARGEADKASNIALQIHDSFILKQSLSKEDLQELISLLPQGFVETDRNFHRKAKQLAEEIGRDDFNAAAELYGKMVQECVTCHSQYAKEKFTGFHN